MGLDRSLSPLQALFAAAEECGLSDGEGLFGEQYGEED